jgi:hypothetical protein
MKLHGSRAAILVAVILLIQFSDVLATGEGMDSKDEMADSVMIMAAQDDSKNISSLLVENNENLDHSTYMDLMKLIRTQYEEDLDYSSKVLNDFVNKNIDSRGAMTSTMTLFILTSKTVDLLDQISPPSDLIEYQNTTQLALINLEGYLWNMVKFYETSKKEYAIQAHVNFNESIRYYKDFNKPI